MDTCLSKNNLLEKDDIREYKEYYFKEYYLKIGHNANNQIILIIYNIQLLDNIKYEIKIDLNDFYTVNKLFKIYDNAKEIYEALIKIIEENNYKIKIQANDLKFIISIGDMFKKNNDIEFTLNKSYNNSEYMGIISREIIIIKDKEISDLKENNRSLNNIIKELKGEIKQLKDEIKELKQNFSELKEKQLEEAKKMSNEEKIKTEKKEDIILLDKNSKDLKLLCVFAFDNLISYFTKKEIKNRFPISLKNKKFPLFVNWLAGKEKKVKGSLGTFKTDNLEDNLRYFSTEAAKEKHFSPITIKDITELHCQINLMFNFEKAKDCYDWEIGKNGITVKFDNYQWTFLPQVIIENDYDKKEALEQLIKCAGYKGKLKAVEKKMIVMRFESTLIEMNYEEYLKYN